MTDGIPEDWLRALQATGLALDADPTELALLASEFREVQLAPGELLVKQGDAGGSLFVIVEGTQRVTVREDDGDLVEVPSLGPGSLVGQVSLVLGGERTATVEAQTPTRALELDRPACIALVERHPHLMKPLTQTLREFMRRGRIVGMLKDIFGEFDAAGLSELEDSLEWVHLESGQVLFNKGDEADGAYIVVVGNVRVIAPTADGGERVLDDVGPAEWIGEMALLAGGPRTATVYALRDTELVYLARDAFTRLAVTDPEAMFYIARLLAARLQGMLEPRGQSVAKSRAFAIVPIGPTVDIAGFVAQFEAGLARHGSVRRLTADVVDAQFGTEGATNRGAGGLSHKAHDHPAQLLLGPWLTQQEDLHDHLIYQCDASWSGWSERAIRHASHIVLVADAREHEALGANERAVVEQFAGGRSPQVSLVLLQQRGRTTFPGTKRWLEGRAHVDQHYHVRRGERGDVERLVRHLTGRAISLVFGGGGSRGYAHVGVLRVFEELGIPVDAACGASIGAIVGGSLAIGLRSAELLRVLRPVFDNLIDPTLPLVSLAAGKNAVRGTAGVVGDLDIEDLLIPYFAISTNLTRSAEVVHRRGPLAFAARASGSLPGVFPPVPWTNGDLLVDGGVINNLPIDRMADLHGGAVVAVDVMPDVDLVVGEQLPMSLSGWEVARRLISPRQESLQVPNIISILMRSANAASHSIHRAQAFAARASLLLKPEVAHWNMLDFKAAPVIADQGYDGTKADIVRWWEQHRDGLLGRDPAN
ncbi:cyclic nucleotide-binding and patatin-like phospholipase domain-containing protein [Enhygromyxa salina]|uniref:NTE family protein RssA n=1 Tax=Enhygromyxa salina TaxID=215803 RepID=A0A2S9YV56_9BACT|nr:cyclic nucleotide-binding and patatin-like phospholipase domain-containing protein [Enhygromyxa salina]PRQ08991.1 NTE family protein RssA [Enhygromyxa salina]